VAVDIPLDLDSGPIVWVKAELDVTLLAALDGITRLQAGETGATVAAVRSNLHRAAGAFELVGVEGLAVLLREFEVHFPDPPEAPRPEAMQTVANACRRLVSHLEEIAVGAQPVPLRFLPEYLALGRLRDARFGPADLFFPDLSRKPRFMEDPEEVDPSKLASYLMRHRRDFQRGFLDWLRGTASETGLSIMERALVGIEAAHPLPAQRSFWWATGALLQAVQMGQVESSTSIKQLFARIDLQIRRLVEGSTKVADRLKREVLYHVARVGDGSPRCNEVKALYGLDVLVPKRVPRELDIVALRPAIERLNEIVTRCKEEWSAVSAQRSGAADRLASALGELPRACDAIGLRSLSELGGGLANVAPLIATRALNDEGSLEFASSLLLLETATQHLAALPKTFSQEVAAALKRLGYATSRAPIPTELLDEMGSGSLTRLAQERETVAHVCREIRTNMRQVEAALDAVFRDSEAVEDLAGVPALLAQVSGALRLLGWNEANHVIAQSSDRIAALVADPSSLDPQEIDRVANALAGFGFYVDARERKESGAEAILESLERSLRGEDAAIVSTPDHSVEEALSARIRTLKGEYANFRASPNDERARSAVVSGLNDVRRDAELLDDAPLARAAKSALNLLAVPNVDWAALQVELTPVVGATAAPQPVSAETQRILDASPASQDTALLEIFIEEAHEVVGNIGGAMKDYLAAPARRELLTDIRRGFHTLKGSGRMVGLQALGDAAWSVERVLNPVLEEGRSLSAHEIELVNVSTERFKGWVEELQSKGHADVAEHPFAALVEKCGISVAPPPPSPIRAATLVAAQAPLEVVEAKKEKALDTIASAIGAASVSGATLALADNFDLKLDSMEHSAPEPASKVKMSSPITAKETALDFEAFEFSTAPAIAPAVAPTPVEVPPTILEEISFDALPPLDSTMHAISGFDTAPILETPKDPVVLDDAPPKPPTWSDELEIDGVRVSRTLFSIMGDEARSHLSTLDQEVALMQFDPSLLPSDSMVRASHTLCGIHRTAGFEAIGHLAGLLEDALIAIRRSKRGEEHLALVSDSVETLRTAVLRLQAQMPVSEVERISVDEASARLEAFITASGGGRGGAAAEMAARESIVDDVTFDESDIEFDLPNEFDAPIAHEAPRAVEVPAFVAPVPSPVPVAEPEPFDLAINQAIQQAHESSAPITLTTPDAPVASPAAAPTVAPEPPSKPAPQGFDLPIWGTVAGAVVGAAGVTAASVSAFTAPPAPAVPPPSPTVEEPRVARVEPSKETTPELSVVLPQEVSPVATPASISVPIDMRVNAPLNLAPAAVVAAPSNVDPLAGINDDIDAQVLPIFLEEAHELFPAASSQLRAWRGSPQDKDHLDSLKRTLHTLKGSARMAGAMRLGELTHIVESAVEEKSGGWTSVELDRVEERFDDVAFVLDSLVAGNYNVVLPRFAAPAEPAAETIDTAVTTPTPTEAEKLAVATDELAAALSVTDAKSAAQPVVAATAAPLQVTPATATTAATAAAATATAATPADSAVAFLRVRTDAVELLADEAGEIAINRSRIESELRGLKTSLVDLTSFVVRLRTLLREIEIQGESQIQSRLDQESTFDPLEFDRYTRFQELTRGLAEGVNDVATVQQNLVKNIDDAETALAAQTRLSRSVQLRLQSLRTVPFSTVSERLYRVLRQTAKDVGKRANLEIEGGRIELDRGVLERLIPVLEHLVRNSFAHGIEVPSAREASGKPQIGEINIAVKQQGNEVAIVFSDDGAGIAVDRIREKVLTAGLAAADEVLTDAQLIEFIFRPGFTTAESVTAIAGRGVGMDVVRSELASLGGRVTAGTTPGVGTTFTLSVPLTLAVTQVLLVNIGGTTYGIPSSLIENVRPVQQRERAIALAAKQIEVAGKFMPYRNMAALLGGRPDPTPHKSYSVAFVRAGDTAAAIEIDKVVGNQEVVAKPYGPQLARLPGMAGLTVLGDGKIVLLMDPLALIRAAGDFASAGHHLASQALASAKPAAPVVVSPASEPASTPPSAPIELSAVELAAAPVTTPFAAPSEAIAANEAMPKEAVVAKAEPPIEEPLIQVETRVPEVTVPFAEPVAKTPVEPPAKAPVEPPPAPVVVEPSVAVVAPPPPPPEPEPEPMVEARQPIVLVVDDSLTVRKITSRLLEREGYKAMTAKDGLDALQVLSTVNPDVILLDIEMPRMDGFEFARTIKSDNRQNMIPIIMITSRTAEKHRNHAMELGVNEYLGKPYQDDQLLGLIQKYTAHVVRP
jgi:chemosensory pili system protein ChpA (sensor histidine kinase/response regulator)